MSDVFGQFTIKITENVFYRKFYWKVMEKTTVSKLENSCLINKAKLSNINLIN